MAISETTYLLELWSRNVCPYCEKVLQPNSRVGTGRKSEGGFCSLDCYAKYYSIELNERSRKVAELAKQHSDTRLRSNDEL
jgi:hypothetical protein